MENGGKFVNAKRKRGFLWVPLLISVDILHFTLMEEGGLKSLLSSFTQSAEL